MTAPDLSTPEGRAVYRSELRRVGLPLRAGGIVVAVAGAVLSVMRVNGWPQVPGWLPMALVVLAVVLMMAAIIRRTRHHRERMRG